MNDTQISTFLVKIQIPYQYSKSHLLAPKAFEKAFTATDLDAYKKT